MAKRGRPPGSKNKKSGQNGNGEAPASAGHNSGDLTEDQRLALLAQHRKKYEAALAAKKKADADLKNVAKLAKAECGEEAIDEIKDMMKLGTEEGEAEFKRGIERQIRMARFMGLAIGAEPDLFEGDRTPAADKAYMDGKRAGMAGDSARPPHDPSTEQYREWMRGHGDGQAVLASGIKKLKPEPTPIEAAADAGDEAAEEDGEGADEPAADDERDVRPSHLRQRDADAIGTAEPTHKVVQ